MSVTRVPAYTLQTHTFSEHKHPHTHTQMQVSPACSSLPCQAPHSPAQRLTSSQHQLHPSPNPGLKTHASSDTLPPQFYVAVLQQLSQHQTRQTHSDLQQHAFPAPTKPSSASGVFTSSSFLLPQTLESSHTFSEYQILLSTSTTSTWSSCNIPTDVRTGTSH